MFKCIVLGFGSNLGSGSQPCDLLNLWTEFVPISRSWRKNCSLNCSSSLPISVARLITGHISTPGTIYPPTPKPSDSCFHHNYLLCFTLSSQRVHHTFFFFSFFFILYLSPGHSYSRPLIGCSGGPVCHLCVSPLLSLRPLVRINSLKSEYAFSI